MSLRVAWSTNEFQKSQSFIVRSCLERKNVFKFHVVYVDISMQVPAESRRGRQVFANWGFRSVSLQVWVLGDKLRSSARTVFSLNLGAISLSLFRLFLIYP